jgi:hypothetical protein
MNIQQIRTYLMVCLLVIVVQPLRSFAQSSDAAKSEQAASAERDGQHDFDPLLGSWKYH